MSLFQGFILVGAGLSVGLAGLAAGLAIGIVGDTGVRVLRNSQGSSSERLVKLPGSDRVYY